MGEPRSLTACSRTSLACPIHEAVLSLHGWESTKSHGQKPRWGAPDLNFETWYLQPLILYNRLTRELANSLRYPPQEVLLNAVFAHLGPE